jgi:hypothetical protein
MNAVPERHTPDGAVLVEPCLLCDVNSIPRASGDAPICEQHREQTLAAFKAAEGILRAHLEQMYGAELDAWVRAGVLPGLAWNLETRDYPPEPTRQIPWRQPGRLVRLTADPDRVAQLLRERIVSALEQEVMPKYQVVTLRVGTTDGRATAEVDGAAMHEALQHLIGELITVDRLRAALEGVPVEAAAQKIIEATVNGETEPETVVETLGVLSRSALTVAFVRQIAVGDEILVDPVEVADQASGGSGEFVFGWWEIRAQLAEPARQWVELLESRFPKARRR